MERKRSCPSKKERKRESPNVLSMHFAAARRHFSTFLLIAPLTSLWAGSFPLNVQLFRSCQISQEIRITMDLIPRPADVSVLRTIARITAVVSFISTPSCLRNASQPFQDAAWFRMAVQNRGSTRGAGRIRGYVAVCHCTIVGFGATAM